MPRKKVNPVEEPEQVNDMELEPQAQEENTEGLEQPAADVLQEDTALPASSEAAPPSDQPPEDMDTPPAEPPVVGQDTGQDGEPAAPTEPLPPEESSAMKPFWMEPGAPPPPPPEPVRTPPRAGRFPAFAPAAPRPGTGHTPAADRPCRSFL